MSSRWYLDETWADAKRRASLDLANHRVIREGEGRWYFGQPNTGMYSGRIVSGPALLLLHGDVDTLVLHPHSRDGVAWLRGCMGVDGDQTYNPQYIAEKVPHELCVTKFDDDAVKYRITNLREEAAEYAKDEDYAEAAQKHREFADDLADQHFDHAGAWDSYYYENCGDYEVSCDDGPPSVTPLSWHFLFQLEFLRHFLMREKDTVDR